ncbi:MAG: efflux transporter outer membrane subunit [Casimicrobiaceae bacterium]
MRKPLIMTALAVALGLAGCAQVPTPTAPPQLDLPTLAATVDIAQAKQLERWWSAFVDPTLDKLVDEALANNLDVRAAIARIESARAQVKLVSRDQYPSLDLNVGASRNRATEAGSFAQPGVPLYSNDFRVALQASYETDFWGKFHGATRAAQVDLVATQYAREIVRTVVAADVARLYFSLVAADAQRALLEDTLKTRVRSIELQNERRKAGIIGDYELGTAQAERDSVVADIAGVRQAIAESESALSVLLGRSPREVFNAQVARSVATDWASTVPAIPAGLPSDLLARRPDVRQSEAQLAAASVRIDVARAAYYPSISLTGALGNQAASLRDLVSAPALIWSVGASLVQPLFGIRAIEANVEVQTAVRNERVVAYTKTVQAAFRDTHDALSANETSRTALAAQSARREKLAAVLELSDLRYRSGYSPFLEVLDAQRQLLLAQTLQITAARNVRLAVVDLAKALGGGWDAAALAEPAEVARAAAGRPASARP